MFDEAELSEDVDGAEDKDELSVGLITWLVLISVGWIGSWFRNGKESIMGVETAKPHTLSLESFIFWSSPLPRLLDGDDDPEVNCNPEVESVKKFSSVPVGLIVDGLSITDDPLIADTLLWLITGAFNSVIKSSKLIVYILKSEELIWSVEYASRGFKCAFRFEKFPWLKSWLELIVTVPGSTEWLEQWKW